MLYSTHSSEISQKPCCTTSKLTPVQAEPMQKKKKNKNFPKHFLKLKSEPWRYNSIVKIKESDLTIPKLKNKKKGFKRGRVKNTTSIK